MSPINDNELVLFHYRDGLEESRLGEIAAALQASEPLRIRYARLCELLDRANASAPEPAEGFERRLWAGLDRRMAEARPRPLRSGPMAWLRDRFSVVSSPRLVWAGGFAMALVIALASGYLVGRNGAQQTLTAGSSSPPSTMADRILDGYVAGHLRAAEGVLMTAANGEGGDLLAGNRELAQSLVESNRLYAAAAARSGNLRLADFLRQLEPVLLEVANRPAASTIEDRQGLRDYLRNTDLLFQVRATESRIDVASKRSL